MDSFRIQRLEFRAAAQAMYYIHNDLLDDYDDLVSRSNSQTETLHSHSVHAPVSLAMHPRPDCASVCIDQHVCTVAPALESMGRQIQNAPSHNLELTQDDYCPKYC